MWNKVIFGILGLGVIAAAAAASRDDDEPDPGLPPDVGPSPSTSVPAGSVMSSVPATVKLKLVKATVHVPTLKGVPATVAREIADALCEGTAAGVTHTPAAITSQIQTPSKVHGTWIPYGWCVAYVAAANAFGIPSGVYLAVWPPGGPKYAFGPFDAYVPVPEPVDNVQDGLEKILGVSVSKAKGWAIK
jgi:hypothetical protein